MQTFPGYWSDVFAHPEGMGLLIYEQPNHVALYVNSVRRSVTAVPDTLVFLRACADGAGNVWFIAQPGTAEHATMIGMVDGAVNLVPLLCYNRPAIGYDGSRVIFYVQSGGRTWKRFVLSEWASAPDLPIPVWPGGDGSTSQGISQVIPGTAADGSQDIMTWADQVFKVEVGGLTMYRAIRANNVIVGQAPTSGLVGVKGPENLKFQALTNFDPVEPRIAYSPVRSVWAVCSNDLQPRVGYEEMPPFVALPVDPPPPSGDPTVPPASPIITFPGYRPTPQASYGRPGYSGPYFATDLRTGNFKTPGNTEAVVNGTVLGGNQQVDRKVFVSLQSTGNDPDKMFGFLSGGNDDSMGNAGIKGCWNWHKSHGHPTSAIVRYYDNTPIPGDFINSCEREAIVQIQCYPRAGESTAQSMARFTESVDRVIQSGRKAGIARAFNTKFGSLKQVLDVQDPLCAMVRSRPAVILDLWFSHGRWYGGVESGAAYCAELLAWEPILAGLFTGLP